MKLWFLSVVLFLVPIQMGCGISFALEDKSYKVGIVVSLKIKPYLDAVQGAGEYLNDHSNITWDVHFLESDEDDNNESTYYKITAKAYDLLMAVGPEAMIFTWERFFQIAPHKMFTMVVRPEKIVIHENQLCGIPLDIPPTVQLKEFKLQFPMLKRVGLIYDPFINDFFAQEASQAALKYGIEIIHCVTGSKKDILTVFMDNRKKVEALWMIPDSTVISESIIQFIIKEAIANDIAVFGYNKYFIESGASLSLVRNYYAVGRQSAEMAVRTLQGEKCTIGIPQYKVMTNPDVIKALNSNRTRRNGTIDN